MAAPFLHDRTNSDSPTIQPNKTIRRLQSSRLSRSNLDSDESFPSEHSSIYDATPILSDENANHGEDIMSSLDLSNCPATLPLSPSLENLDRLAGLPPDNTLHVQETLPTSHSNWPTSQLETITERRSISTLHTSASLPRLNAPTTRQSSIDEELHNHDSASQRPSHRPRSRRSFSENDASCQLLRMSKGVTPTYKEHQSDSSSSSDELLSKRCLATWPTFPLKPLRPPPARSPTPPGLPSFGSPEAIRLMTLPGIRGASVRTNQARPSQRNRLPANVGQGMPPPLTPALRPIDNPRSPKGKSVIRRIIRNCSRSASDEAPEGEGRRVSLPAGFVARADDGTYVRGRFGARSSGHGVGARTSQQLVGLEGHPFHRLEPAGRMLEDEVRDIDKACEENGRTQSRRAEDTVQQRIPNSVHSPRLQSPMVIPETGGPSRSWGFWQPCRSNPVNTTDLFAPSEAAGLPSSMIIPETRGPSRSWPFWQFCPSSPVDTQDIFPPPEATSVPIATRGTIGWRAGHAPAKRTLARLEEERNRKQDKWEARCWNSVHGWCCEESSTNREVSAVINRENGGNGLRRSSVISEEPGPVNARMVYPTVVSEEEAIN